MGTGLPHKHCREFTEGCPPLPLNPPSSAHISKCVANFQLLQETTNMFSHKLPVFDVGKMQRLKHLPTLPTHVAFLTLYLLW